MGYVDGKNRLYAPGATVKNLTGKKDWQTNITLYAQWEPYQAKLEANGGQFLDGQESKILPVTGQTALISLPDGDEVKREGMELVAWAGEAQPAFDPSTPFYLPGSDVEAAKGSDFYAQWLADEQLFLYHGPDGSVRIQKPEGETVSLYGAETFLQDGKPLLIWNTEADGSGESYLPGASVEHSRWGDKVTHFYALCGATPLVRS